ncbi:MAG TPA: acyl-CoA thioesterase [Gemmatimonadaceae bacterium]|nr:acyl-CoA thioesterase [Gemmatimonadaceae bacterium]
MPTDLDVLLHVNNGKYLSMMDLGRLDLMRRAGIYAPIRERGWYPVVTAQTIQYRRSLRLFQRFEIVTRVLWWDDKYILLEQRFERGSEPVAHGLIRGRFLSRGGEAVPMRELIALAGNPPRPTDVPDYALRWNADQQAFRGHVTEPQGTQSA